MSTEEDLLEQYNTRQLYRANTYPSTPAGWQSGPSRKKKNPVSRAFKVSLHSYYFLPIFIIYEALHIHCVWRFSS
jgi:hypothetical protein